MTDEKKPDGDAEDIEKASSADAAESDASTTAEAQQAPSQDAGPKGEAEANSDPESPANASANSEVETESGPESPAKEEALEEEKPKDARPVAVDAEAKAAPTKPQAPMMIEAKGLTKIYGRFAAIRNVTFAIPKGQIVAFLGPNGAGKSTTMKILTGFLAPTEGEARIAGIDVLEDRMAAARRLGYMPESGPLYLDMTPQGLLSFVAEARGFEGSELEERVHRAIALCHLEEVIEKPIAKLSKGFRQRVGMAQAFLHDPDVLILDEPTSGLDPNQIRDVRDNIRRAGEHKTILLSTHILQEVEAMADRVIFISEGQVVFDGPTSELSGSGISLEDRFYELTRPVTAGRS